MGLFEAVLGFLGGICCVSAKRSSLFGYFAVNIIFEFCGVFERFVYDFSASAGQFGSDVFNDDLAVMLAVNE